MPNIEWILLYMLSGSYIGFMTGLLGAGCWGRWNGKWSKELPEHNADDSKNRGIEKNELLMYIQSDKQEYLN